MSDAVMKALRMSRHERRTLGRTGDWGVLINVVGKSRCTMARAHRELPAGEKRRDSGFAKFVSISSFWLRFHLHHLRLRLHLSHYQCRALDGQHTTGNTDIYCSFSSQPGLPGSCSPKMWILQQEWMLQ